MCKLSPTLSACSRCRTLIGTYFLYGFSCGLVACAVLCCAVLAVLLYSRCSSTTCSCMVKKNAHESKKLGKYGSSMKHKMKKEKYSQVATNLYICTRCFAPRAPSAARCPRSHGKIEQNANEAGLAFCLDLNKIQQCSFCPSFLCLSYMHAASGSFSWSMGALGICKS